MLEMRATVAMAFLLKGWGRYLWMYADTENCSFSDSLSAIPWTESVALDTFYENAQDTDTKKWKIAVWSSIVDTVREALPQPSISCMILIDKPVQTNEAARRGGGANTRRSSYPIRVQNYHNTWLSYGKNRITGWQRGSDRDFVDKWIAAKIEGIQLVNHITKFELHNATSKQRVDWLIIMAIATLLIFATIIATIIMGDVTDDVIISIKLFVKCSNRE